MQALKIVYIICAAAAGVAILAAAVKSRRARKNLLISGAAGVAALIALSLASPFTGFCLPINLWTLLCAASAGLPGTLLMAAVKLIWLL